MESKYHSCRSNCLPQAPNDTAEDEKKTSDGDTSRQWFILQDGFPPGFTVDELKNHRKRRPAHASKPQDNLHVEPGSLKTFRTEYSRRFAAPAREFLTQSRPFAAEEWKLERDMDRRMMGEYKEKYQDFPRERPHPLKPESNLKTPNTPMNFQTEKMDRFVVYPKMSRTKPLRRNTALKSEGELFTETENRREFQPPGSLDRTRALKRPTTLKLEGLFETLSSEQKENYIAYLAARPGLIKRETQLKLDGALEFDTECQASFTSPKSQARPHLRKRTTSLKLEGEVELTPEYRKSFTQLPQGEGLRPHAVRPQGNLHAEGDLDMETEFRSKFTPIKPTDVPASAKLEDSIRLQGELSLNPEYREKFISHGKSKSEILRRRDNLNLEGEFSYETENIKYTPSFAAAKADRQISSSLSNSEYHTQFVNFPRSRPLVQRPPSNFLSSGQKETTSENSRNLANGSLDHATPTRHQQNLTTGGGTEGEYRDKFIAFPVNYSKSPKPADTFSTDYSSFQILDEAEKKIMEPLLPSNPSPTFKLQVQNMDGKPQGFHPSPERIYPREAVVSQTKFASNSEHEAAFEAALRRRQSHQQRCSSSETKTVPGRSGKHYFDENANEPAFTVIDNKSF